MISGGTEANLVAPLLKEKNIPVILGNVLSLPASEDAFHAATYQLAGELAQAGRQGRVLDRATAPTSRHLPYHAAMSVAWGMKRDEAIKALTINAAEILGVADRVGSLEAGKDANLFISKGDPLEVKTAVTQRLSTGRTWASTTSTSSCIGSTSRGRRVPVVESLRPEGRALSGAVTASREYRESRTWQEDRCSSRTFVACVVAGALAFGVAPRADAPHIYAIRARGWSPQPARRCRRARS